MTTVVYDPRKVCAAIGVALLILIGLACAPAFSEQ